MGMYTWLSDKDFEIFSAVTDKDINEALQEVRSVMPQWYIQEKEIITKGFWGTSKVRYTYNVYQRTQDGYEEVRYQVSATTKETVLNLLYGLYMGYNSNNNNITFR